MKPTSEGKLTTATIDGRSTQETDNTDCWQTCGPNAPACEQHGSRHDVGQEANVKGLDAATPELVLGQQDAAEQGSVRQRGSGAGPGPTRAHKPHKACSQSAP